MHSFNKVILKKSSHLSYTYHKSYTDFWMVRTKSGLNTFKNPRVKHKSKSYSEAPAPIVTDKFTRYEVEKVLGSKVVEVGRMYYVKWAGYSSKWNSWIEELPVYFKTSKATYDDEESESDVMESDASLEYASMDEEEISSDESAEESAEESADEDEDSSDDEVVSTAEKKAVKKSIAKKLKNNKKTLAHKENNSSNKYRFISKTLAALAEMVGDEDSD